MNENDKGASRRRGGIAATSKSDGNAKISLGDIADLEAYVGKVARTITQDEQELEDLTAEGIAFAYERQLRLQPGESLGEAISTLLEYRLRDYRRKQHREWRRNGRTGITYSLPEATGLSWEHDGATTAGMPAGNEEGLIESRLGLDLFNGPEDLRNPRLIGRYKGVPSAAGLATVTSLNIWAEIEEERNLTRPRSCSFRKRDL